MLNILLGCYNMGPSTWSPYLEYIGDGFCNDVTNIPECRYDGGDCCGDNINTAYCSACQCLGCPWSWRIGDGFCNDITNTPECSYDGGDCCGDNVNTQNCSECQCLEPDKTTPISTSTTTPKPPCKDKKKTKKCKKLKKKGKCGKKKIWKKCKKTCDKCH